MQEERTALGEEIASMDSAEIRLDRNIKNILAYKPILARIFRETVIECKEMTYDEILQCIEGEVHVDTIGLHPGTSNVQKIEGRTQEDAVYREGKVTYDIRTVLRIPNGEELGIKLLVDVEAQNDDTPGYDLTERAIFYCGRMLSAQLSTEFTNSTADKVKYGNLKKVYSIWICTDTAQERTGTIERYHLHRTVYPGNRAEDINSRFDLLEAVFVNVDRNKKKNGQSELLNLLADLFDETRSGEEKVELLKQQHDIPTTTTLEEEVTMMTAYAARLIANGRAEGRNEGRSEGRAEGRAQERVAMIRKMMEKGNSKETILEYGYTEEEIEEAFREFAVKS